MFLWILDMIENSVKNYTEAYIFTNRASDLAVQLNCHISEDDKERLLNDFDQELPYGLNFSHEYKNGKLEVVFTSI